MDTTQYHIFEILRDLVRIASPSGDEDTLARHIAATYFTGGWDVRIDECFNLIAEPEGSDGGLPLLNAHMDTSPYGVKDEDDAWKLADEEVIAFDGATVTKKYEDLQCGFDDKAGIAIILALKERIGPQFRVLLTTQEEVGGCGVKHALRDERNHDFFADTPFAFTIDRRSTSGSDIIHTYAGLKMCPDRYVEEIEAVSAGLGAPMKGIEGSSRADCLAIARACRIPIVNLSCGFMNEHHPHDALDMNKTFETLRVVEECLRDPGRLAAAAGRP